MILGQALIDVLLAATRWTHLIRYEVAARSIVEPYAALAAAALAFYAGYAASGLLIAYWAGTLATLAFALAGARRCAGARLAARLADRAPPAARDAAGRARQYRHRRALRPVPAARPLSGRHPARRAHRRHLQYGAAAGAADPAGAAGFRRPADAAGGEDAAPRGSGQGGERDRLGDPADPGAAAADGGCDVRGRPAAARLAGAGIRGRLAGCDPARLRRDRAGRLRDRRPAVRLPAAAARPPDLRRQCRRRPRSPAML